MARLYRCRVESQVVAENVEDARAVFLEWLYSSVIVPATVKCEEEG
ncbi:hypothetical protein [Pyrodictium abyssi]|uniref:Uncharacterized protein n=1 Tax=Pyrodictium abyssi TaxID=54256 RepID=A0ABN6ZQP1_9CREN|nr:hypothetical protein PABY_21580 [Pyrodictium abyssi]